MTLVHCVDTNLSSYNQDFDFSKYEDKYLVKCIDEKRKYYLGKLVNLKSFDEASKYDAALKQAYEELKNTFNENPKELKTLNNDYELLKSGRYEEAPKYMFLANIFVTAQSSYSFHQSPSKYLNRLYQNWDSKVYGDETIRQEFKKCVEPEMRRTDINSI